MARSLTPTEEVRPRIDPSMFVYCPIHSEELTGEGERQGQVIAHYNGETGRYECGVCATARWEGMFR